MKEIKFRLWDDNTKRWVSRGESVEIAFSQSFPESIKAEANFYLEQYTGLKDKNGKEIYEGDIVNLEYYEKPSGKKRWRKTYPHKGGKDINIVGFEDGFFKFYAEDKDGYGSELSFSDYGEWEGKDGAYKYAAEVIGNIHENPELLKGEE